MEIPLTIQSATVSTATSDDRSSMMAHSVIAPSGDRHLEERSSRLLDLIDNIPGIVWETETAPDLSVIRFNYLSDSAERLLGYSREELLQPVTWQEMVYPDDLEIFLHQHRNLFVNGDRGTIQHRVVTKDGRVAPIEATITLVRNADGIPIAMRGVTVDISERYRSTQRWKFLARSSELLAESLDVESTLAQTTRLLIPEIADLCLIHLRQPDGEMRNLALAASNPDLEITFRETMEKYPRSAAARESINAALGVKRSWLVSEVTDELLQTYSESEEHLGLLRKMELQSSILALLSVPSPLVGDGILGTLFLSLAGPKRRFTEEDQFFVEELARQSALAIYRSRLLADSRAEMERRLEIQKHLEEAKEAAEVASRTKDQFIATLSHELRTPLTPVLATVDLLSEDKELPEGFRPFIDLIRRNIEIEARLIDDLLDMTRIVKGKLHLTEADLDLHSLIPDVIEICRQELDSNKLRIVVQLHAANSRVHGDKDRMSQVFWNLIHNATKFTPEHGIVTLRTRNDDAGHVIIEIQDTGKGIDSSELRVIFEPFEQEHSVDIPQPRVSAQSGLGLGLAISKSIVELHGGTIEAQSPGPGKGSTFTVRLKVSEAKPFVEKKEFSKPLNGVLQKATGHGERILLVDDHLDTNIALKILLERRGYKVLTASSVAKGLELAYSNEFDLLISDIGLPDGDGLQLLQEIRKKSHIKAIAVSGYGTEIDLQRSLEAGFHRHIKKPIAFPDLERAIAELLSDLKSEQNSE